MSAHPSLATLLESFFHTRLAKQRNASPATIANYRDTSRMLILFAAERRGRRPCSLTVEEIDRDLILASWTRSSKREATKYQHGMHA